MYYRNPQRNPRAIPRRRQQVPVRRPNQAPTRQHPQRQINPVPQKSVYPRPEPAFVDQQVAPADPDSVETKIEAQPDDEATLWKERYARLQAELENDKKRMARRNAVEAIQARNTFLEEMLIVADNLQAALAHSDDTDSSHLREGVGLTLRSFLDTLAKHKVELMQVKGTAFDPEWHEAMGFLDSPDFPSGYVAEVLQQGYTVDGALLRPARVLVAQ